MQSEHNSLRIYSTSSSFPASPESLVLLVQISPGLVLPLHACHHACSQSTSASLNHVVPQGSFLCPLLFTICLVPLGQIICPHGLGFFSVLALYLCISLPNPLPSSPHNHLSAV
ncbi:hypothetical protein AMECASPLE_023459 [Ameca splendens]|uniref:Uncharacterized protein n=1 Tax=Ameca splendens TaxID=208324 RepID=A0ABV0ZCY4_9TELE